MTFAEKIASKYKNQVYWRTCSVCGGVERDSLERALKQAVIETIEKCARECEKQADGCVVQDTICHKVDACHIRLLKGKA